MTTSHAPPVPSPAPASDAALIGRSLDEPALNPYGYDAGVTVGRSTYLESRVVDAIPPH